MNEKKRKENKDFFYISNNMHNLNLDGDTLTTLLQTTFYYTTCTFLFAF